MNNFQKPRIRVRSGGILSTEQIVQVNTGWLARTLDRIDTDEVLRKAGISRSALSKMTFDDEIDQALDTRRNRLDGQEFTLSPSEGPAAQLVYFHLENHLDKILDAAMDSIFYGYDVAEILWMSTEQQKCAIVHDENGNKIYYGPDGVEITKEQYDALWNIGTKFITDIISKPIEWFNPTNEGLIWEKNFGESETISDWSDFRFRFLYQRNNPNYKDPKGKAILSRVYWLWFFKSNGWKFWSKFLERFGSPLLIGKTNAISDEEAQNFSDSILAAHSSGAVTIGADEDVTAITSAGNGEAFIAYAQELKRRIVTYILGQTLTTGTDTGGTYGQGVVHQEQQEIIFAADRKHAAKAVQHVINIICEANGVQPPQFKWVSDKGLQPERVDRDQGLYAIGVRFTSKYIEDEYDMRPEHFYMVMETAAQTGISASQLLNDFKNQAVAANGQPTKEIKFSPAQQIIEEHAAETLNLVGNPLDVEAVKNIAKNCKSAKEFEDKLYEMVGFNIDKYVAILDQALLTADLLGFVFSEKGES